MIGIRIPLTRRAKTALAREKRNGLTLEFSPHDSTLLQIEGVGNKITRITKMVIVIEEKIRETKDYSQHKGTRDSSPVCVYVVKLSEATYEATKRAIVARDQASSSIDQCSVSYISQKDCAAHRMQNRFSSTCIIIVTHLSVVNLIAGGDERSTDFAPAVRPVPRDVL